jgi:predicted secreted protein
MYRYEVTGLGTSGSQVRGRLAYGGNEVPAPQVNDFYKTPWGYMYWVGDDGDDAAKRGWLMSPLTGVSRRGRELTPQEPGGRIVQLGEADNRREIPLPVGSGIIVNLPGNPKTGNEWKISKISSGSVEPVTRRPTFTADPGRSGQTGSGGTYSFKLKTVRPGKTTVELAYGKAASAYGRPERTFTVTIEVQ